MTLLVGTSLFIAPAVALVTPALGPALGDLICSAAPWTQWLLDPGTLPLLPAVTTTATIAGGGIAALPLTPPVEHGLMTWVKYRARPRLLGRGEVDYLIGNPVIDRDVAYIHGQFVAMWELPSVSMRLASEAARSVARAQWAAFLDGLPCPIQTVVRAKPVDLHTVLGVMAKDTNPNGALIAQHLQASTAAGGEVQRNRYLSIRADSRETLEQRAIDIEGALARATLRGKRLEDDDLADMIHANYSRKPRRKGKIGPQTIRVESDGLNLDGEWITTVALQRWPSSVMTDFMSTFYDGTTPVEIVQDIRPVDTSEVKRNLRDRLQRLETTKLTRERKLAIKQLDEMLDALEQHTEEVFDVQMFFLVRAATRPALLTARRQIEQAVDEMGGQAAHMRWEHPATVVACAGTGEVATVYRNHRVDTSSISRAYPFGASEIALDGAVPWGVTMNGNRRQGWTPWARPIIPNPHIVFYATTGGGKGFALKILDSRLLFAGVLDEGFYVDQAEESEDGEYGRFARYVGGEVRKLSKEHWHDDLRAALADIPDGTLPRVVVLNVAELATDERCKAFVAFKHAVFRRAAKRRAKYRLAVDEVWSYAEDLEAAREAEDIVRRGRHLQLSGAFATQRPMEALDSRLGRVIQSLCATQWYGMMMPAEITDVAARLRWTDEQTRLIESFGQGDGMMAVGLHRVAFRVDFSRDEWDMAQTDSVIARPHDSIGYATVLSSRMKGISDATRSAQRDSRDESAPSWSDAHGASGVLASDPLDTATSRGLVSTAG